jgi:hypothetical protein
LHHANGFIRPRADPDAAILTGLPPVIGAAQIRPAEPDFNPEPYRFETIDCRLPTVDCRLSTAD